MSRYIFAERNGIHIIDLQKTIVAIKDAYETVRQSVLAGKHVLFVGTKKQAQQSIEREARRCNMFYVNNRWLGGMLTNFSTMKRSLLKPEEDREDGSGRHLCQHDQERDFAHAEGAGAPGAQPGRDQGNEGSAGSHVRGRHAQGSDRDRRGQQDENSGGGDRRHQLQPGRDRSADPGATTTPFGRSTCSTQIVANAVVEAGERGRAGSDRGRCRTRAPTNTTTIRSSTRTSTEKTTTSIRAPTSRRFRSAKWRAPQ